MSLVAYAESELALAGIAGDDGYDGMLYEGIMQIVKTFAEQGHSGFSAHQTLAIITKLLAFKPLTPLTYDDTEWIKHDVGMGSLWQNKRQSTIFSDDEGKTWYDIEEEDSPRHPIEAKVGA